MHGCVCCYVLWFVCAWGFATTAQPCAAQMSGPSQGPGWGHKKRLFVWGGDCQLCAGGLS